MLYSTIPYSTIPYTLLLATGNPSKTREISAVLTDLPVKILTLAQLPNRAAEPDETGETFEENARIKAQYWCDITGLPTLADDSGILVEALPGELGVKTVRWGKGNEASDAEWLQHFLERMEGEENRAAKFVSVVAIAQPGKPTEFFSGEVKGKILHEAAAPLLPKIPLSSVFLADGAEKVFAAMSSEEKAQHSHRGKALAEAKKFLERIIE
jgi:XTP/dITP diphosphohydrolase